MLVSSALHNIYCSGIIEISIAVIERLSILWLSFQVLYQALYCTVPPANAPDDYHTGSQGWAGV